MNACTCGHCFLTEVKRYSMVEEKFFWENGAGTTGFDKERERVEGRKEGREERSVGGRAKDSLLLSHWIHKN